VALAGEPGRRRSYLAGGEAAAGCTLERGDERSDRGLLEQYTVLVPDDRLRGPAARKRDNRASARVSLDRDDAEVLLTRENPRERLAVLVTDVFVGQPPEKLDLLPGARFEPPPIGTVADDSQRGTDALARLHRQLDPFIGNEGRHD